MQFSKKLLAKSYDYVVVGAGSAGCLMANRLSADPSVKVALIEAGSQHNSPLVNMPIGVGFLCGFSRKHNWRYETEPDKGMNGRKIYWPRGKGVGGSSSINAMVYIRGQKEDYDSWAAQGNTSWSYNKVLPLFKYFENNVRGENDFHGAYGELSVSDPGSPNIISHAFVDACEESGIKRNNDFNGADQEGAGMFQTSTKSGQRHSSYKAYIEPILSERTNLDVICDATTSKVILEDNRAVGIEYIPTRGGKQVTSIKANKEVVLCGGSINSPQILNMSGIGDKEELSKAGIECVVNIPGVGKNLQDHPDFVQVFEGKDKTAIGIGLEPVRAAKNLYNYYHHGTGEYTSTAAEAGAFFKSSPEIATPDIQLHFCPAYVLNDGRILKYGHGISTHACLLRPKSRGSLMVTTNNIRSAPKIFSNYFDHPDDMKDMKNGVLKMNEIFNQPALRKYTGAEYGVGVPVPDWNNDAEVENFIRERSGSVYHPVGTCKMGEGDESVVDEQGRVHNVKGLRVADASIMPTLVSGNTNAPTMMIAEKVAREIISRELVSKDFPSNHTKEKEEWCDHFDEKTANM